MFKLLTFLLPVIFILAGCAPQGAMSLQRLANSQADLQEDIKQNEKFFSALMDDIKNNRLQKGMSQPDILAKYGEPIFTRPLNVGVEKKEFMLYRRPTAYFSSDLIYLYFDREKNLSAWKIKPPK